MELHPEYAEVFNYYLSLLTIVGMLGLVGSILYMVYRYVFIKKPCRVLVFIAEHTLSLSFFATFVGVTLSLFYSEVLRYTPCDLCWYQRVFLYPQLFLFGYAWYKKDKAIIPYAFIVSMIGASIGIYHHMLQIGYDLMKPCSDAPFAVDCAKPSFIEFGFITFPLMSAVLFGYLLVIGVNSYLSRNKN